MPVVFTLLQCFILIPVKKKAQKLIEIKNFLIPSPSEFCSDHEVITARYMERLPCTIYPNRNQLYSAQNREKNQQEQLSILIINDSSLSNINSYAK